jgi:hypothetical protein
METSNENVTGDIRPIYLGYCEKEDKYYFYALKKGIPRFLSYVAYFFWDRGPSGILEFKEIPEQIELELQQFLEGILYYEHVKLRKNSRNTTAKKCYRLPEELEEYRKSQETESENRKPDTGSKGPVILRRARRVNPIGDGELDTSSKGDSPGNPAASGGRPRRLRLQDTSSELATNLVTPPPKRRGRPKGSKNKQDDAVSKEPKETLRSNTAELAKANQHETQVAITPKKSRKKSTAST